MSVVRVVKPCVVVPDGTLIPVALRLHEPFDSDDPVVRQFGWAFESDEVEQATAVPGERRNVTRR